MAIQLTFIIFAAVFRFLKKNRNAVILNILNAIWNIKKRFLTWHI